MQRRRLPPLNALLAFEAAARHGSFTRAAEELSVAQPAVTRHIANIENWLGTPVFTRRGNRVVLTDQGSELAELATSGFDRMELGLRNILASDDRELRVGASFGISHLWLMPRISGMRIAAGATINFLTSDNYREFDDPTVDFSIQFGTGDFGDKRADLLFPETCQIIASPDYLAAHPEFDAHRLAETTDRKHLLEHGDPYDRGWMSWPKFAEMTGQPLSSDRPFERVASYPTMLDMIAAGEGVGIGYWGLEDRLVEKGHVRRVGPKLSRENCGYYMVYDARAEAKKTFRKLRAHLFAEKSRATET